MDRLGEAYENPAKVVVYILYSTIKQIDATTASVC